jgi:hypothetical protein
MLHEEGTPMGIALKRISAAVMAAVLGAALFAVITPKADASHEPANKFAAAGSDLDTVFAEEDEVILSETMKVSSPFDLLLQATAECSILTKLTTGDGPDAASDSAFAYGSVRLRVEIDGTPVPVSADDTASGGGQDDIDDDDNEIGEVTFCNRAYERKVTDNEDNTPPDGQDTEEDYIRTRTANAFNWVATDVGFTYDKPLPGQSNNVVKIELIADYDTETAGTALADAFVGSRTLVAEPTNLSVHEVVANDGGAGS